MSPIKATWTKLASAEQLQRSSNTVTVVNNAVYIFGGELKPREPRDNDIHQISITGGATTPTVNTLSASGDAPSPRVGSATTKINDTIYLFSGRGGVAMAPINESGSIWSFSTTSQIWTLIKPSSSIFPDARSYHCMTSNGKDTIFVHAGCPEKGRLSDLWSFNLSSRAWKQLASAPDPPRGGASIAFANGKLWRMNGFDGEKEQGGGLDVYDLENDSWTTISFAADGVEGPGARSVAALLPVIINSDAALVTLFGESDPSSLGHQGAGKMLSDIWTYSLRTGAWSQVSAQGKHGLPDARGWFDADVASVDGKDSVVVSGGLGESNDRLDDLWTLNF